MRRSTTSRPGRLEGEASVEAVGSVARREGQLGWVEAVGSVARREGSVEAVGLVGRGGIG